MRRTLFTLAAALSAVLFLAGGVLLVRGFVVSDHFFWQAFEDEGDRSYWRQDVVSSGGGAIGMCRTGQSTGRGGWETAKVKYGPEPFHRMTPAAHPRFWLGVGDEPVWGGFKYGSFAAPDGGRRRPRAYGWQVVVPYWAILPALAALPAGWVWQWRRWRRRHGAGCCPACGYDLRATPGRCPECGTPAAG